jgi:hypothetical protein
MTEPKVLLDAQLEVLQGYAEDRDLPQMVGVLKEARAQLDALAAEVENAITNTLEAQAKSRIDEEQCDRMTEDAGNMAMKIKRLREALEWVQVRTLDMTIEKHCAKALEVKP